MIVIDRDPLVREILQLRGEVDELKEALRQIKEALRPVSAYPADWGLTRKESELLHVLRRGGGLTLHRERLLVALYGFEVDVGARILDVMICKMRKKLKPFGIGFSVVRGEGFGLTSGSLAVIDAAMQSGPRKLAA